jgi:fatty acid-binding protein DegV
MLDIKPILELRDGIIEPVARVRTFARVLDHLADAAVEASARWKAIEVTIGHADRPDVAHSLADRIRARAADADIRVIDVGPVIGCHAGPGAAGIAFRPLHLGN